MFDLSDPQKAALGTDGHLLITGGPGSGKTTISILKAAQIAEEKIRKDQRVLFLSFARATVARVMEAIEEHEALSREVKRQIEVETYHAFFWQVLKTHGYLAGLPRRISLMAPAVEAVALAPIRRAFGAKESSKAKLQEREKQIEEEKQRLAMEEGRICFDLFAPLVGRLLSQSDKIRKVTSNRYPYVVLDEFQDTNQGQWDVVRELGKNGTLIALADPEQRIFDFIGADPQRLDQFKELFKPTCVEFGGANHRSNGTDILAFGDAILSGKFRKEPYVGVRIGKFANNTNQAMASLCGSTRSARNRLLKAKKKNWSLAVLVPTKKMTRQVSEYFRAPVSGIPPIDHSAAIDMEGAILAAEVVAHLLEPDTIQHFEVLIGLICAYYRGKGGDTPSATSLDEANAIEKAFGKAVDREKERKSPASKSIINAMREVHGAVAALKLVGDPDADWRSVCAVLSAGNCKKLKLIAEEVRNIRLLQKGTLLRQSLAEDWRLFGAYRNALAIVRAAFVQEHFANAQRAENGVIVMNIHKAKGKQFDEVIIFEGWPIIVKRQLVSNSDRIVRGNQKEGDTGQARQAFRVSVTRARSRTTVLTPVVDPCVLLDGANGGN